MSLFLSLFCHLVFSSVIWSFLLLDLLFSPCLLHPIMPTNYEEKLLEKLFLLHYLNKRGTDNWKSSLKEMLRFCCQLWKLQTPRLGVIHDGKTVEYIHNLYLEKRWKSTKLDDGTITNIFTYDLLKNILEYGFKSGAVYSLEYPTDLSALLKHTDSENCGFVDGVDVCAVKEIVKNVPQQFLEFAYALVHERYPHRSVTEWREIHVNTNINESRYALKDYREYFRHFSSRFPHKYKKIDTKNTQLHDEILVNFFLTNCGPHADIPGLLAATFLHKSVAQWKKHCEAALTKRLNSLAISWYDPDTWKHVYNLFLPRYELVQAGQAKDNPIELDDKEEEEQVETSIETYSSTNILQSALNIFEGFLDCTHHHSTPSEVFLACFNEAMKQETSFFNREKAYGKLKKLCGQLNTEQSTSDISPTNLERFESLVSPPSSSQMSVPESVLGEFNGSGTTKNSLNTSEETSNTSGHTSTSKYNSTAEDTSGNSSASSNRVIPMEDSPPSSPLYIIQPQTNQTSTPVAPVPTQKDAKKRDRKIRHELIISKKQRLNGGKGLFKQPQIQSRTPQSCEIHPRYPQSRDTKVQSGVQSTAAEPTPTVLRPPGTQTIPSRGSGTQEKRFYTQHEHFSQLLGTPQGQKPLVQPTIAARGQNSFQGLSEKISQASRDSEARKTQDGIYKRPKFKIPSHTGHVKAARISLEHLTATAHSAVPSGAPDRPAPVKQQITSVETVKELFRQLQNARNGPSIRNCNYK
ncbi:YALIA101S07e03334g1_1 [Yarrowia lipolytica]|nr:YALIA101S07e03334g1_1 [Yarrowia lipolytica]